MNDSSNHLLNAIAAGLTEMGKISLRHFTHTWVYLVIGIVAGALISIYVPKKSLARAFNHSGFPSIILASLLGVISPLGSYAVIPIFATMLANGFPLAPVMTFLTASPLMSPYVLITTWGILGHQMALARLAAALVLSVSCGLIIKALTNKGKLGEWAEINPALHSSSGTQDFWSLAEKKLNPENKHKAALRMMWGITKFSGKYFILSIILGSALEAFLPHGLIGHLMGAQNRFSILWGATLGVPIYVCGGATVPFILSLLEQGMDKGSALAFFIVGPATRVSPMVALLALVSKRPFFLYLGLCFAGGILFGYLYRLL
jgi:uncharacterized membrane protein YraQ (UPF0718 family)